MEQSESYTLSKHSSELKDENIDINILNQTKILTQMDIIIIL